MIREATTPTCQVQSSGGCWQSKEAAGSWPILQEVVPRWVEASTATGSRFNDCNLLAFKDTLLLFLSGWWSKMRADDAMQDRYQRGMLYCVA